MAEIFASNPKRQDSALRGLALKNRGHKGVKKQRCLSPEGASSAALALAAPILAKDPHAACFLASFFCTSKRMKRIIARAKRMKK